MINKLNKLNKLRSEFSEDLSENGFLLSDIASKTNRMPKIVSSMIVSVILSSAVAPAANAQGADVVKYSKESIVKIEGEINHKIESIASKYALNSNLLDSESILKVAEDGLSGAFRLPSSGDVVFIYNKNNIELNSNKDQEELNKVVADNFELFNSADFAVTTVYGENVKYGGHDFNLVKLGYDSFSSHIDNFANKYPTLAKHEKLIETLHELAHAEHSMSTVTDKMDNQSLGSLERLLVNEGYATIFSLAAFPKVKSKLSNTEVLNLMKEHSQQRSDSANSMDAGHGASYVIDNLVSSLENNPRQIDYLRDMSFKEIVHFSKSLTEQATMDFAIDTELSDGHFISGGLKHEIPTVEADVRYYAEHGNNGEKYALKGIQSRNAVLKYDIAVKSLAKTMRENGGDWNSARRKSVDENGNRSYTGAYDSFRILDQQYQLNESMKDYKVNDNEAASFVLKAFKDSGYSKNRAEEYSYKQI